MSVKTKSKTPFKGGPSPSSSSSPGGSSLAASTEAPGRGSKVRTSRAPALSPEKASAADAYRLRMRLEAQMTFTRQEVADHDFLALRPPHTVIDLSAWANCMDEAFVAEACAKAERISLKMCNITGLSKELCGWLGTHAGPKIVEIYVADCRSINISHMKRILEYTVGLEHITLLRNPWVDDYCFDQFCIRFGRTIRTVTVEFCKKLTDATCEYLAKKCLGLKHVSIVCCPGITDQGMLQLSKRVRLTSFCLSHNMNITDKGIEAIISSGDNMTSLKLIDCPNISDRSISAIYEAIVSWGRKSNDRMEALRELEVADNSNITQAIFQWVAGTAFNIESLRLPECSNMILSDKLSNAVRMKNLRHLVIGPGSEEDVNKEDLVGALMDVAPQLETLHLIRIGLLTDFDVGVIVAECVALTDFATVDIDVGNETVESLCSFTPNIVRYEVTGSAVIINDALRCIMAICKKLKEITVQNCRNITDDGFSRCAILKLNKVTVQSFGDQINGYFLSSFANSPIRELHVAGTTKLRAINGVHRMSFINLVNIEEVYMSHCLSLDVEDVAMMLRSFVFCRVIDLTGCDHLITKMKGLRHRFMEFESSPNFLGFRTTDETLASWRQFRSIMTTMKRNWNALTIQKMFRRFQRRMSEIAEMKIAAQSAFIMKCIRSLQAKQRMKTFRKWFRRVRASIIKIQCAYRWYRTKLRIEKWRQAYFQYRYFAKRTCFGKAKKFSDLSSSRLTVAYNRLGDRNKFRRKRKTFQALKNSFSIHHDELIFQSAYVLYEISTLRKVLRAWHTIIGETKPYKLLLTKVFASACDLSTYNSTRQRRNVMTAENYNMRRLLIFGFRGFSDGYYKAMKAETFVPAAKKIYMKNFMKSMFIPSYKELYNYMFSRRRKHARELKAHKFWVRYSYLRSCRRLWRFAGTTLTNKARSNKVDKYRYDKFSVDLIENMNHNVFASRYNRRVALMSKLYGLTTHLIRFQKGVARYRTFEKMSRKALAHRDRRKRIKVLLAWSAYAKYAANMEDYVIYLRTQKIMLKVFAALVLFKNNQKAYRAEVAKSLNERGITSGKGGIGNFERLLELITRIQSRMRGIMQRKRYREERIATVWATQTLQNLVRRGIAMRKWRKKYREARLIDLKREEVELELMRQEDIEMQYFFFFHRQARHIQRVFRGRLGRREAKSRAKDAYREQNLAFYDQMLKERDDFAVFQRLMKALEVKRHRAATQIQKIARGRQARYRFKALKKNFNRDQFVILIQRCYRGHLARLALDAIRRKRAHEVRFNAARRQRGHILRALGFKKKKTQNALSRYFLSGLGLDPISFNYRVNEIWQDIKGDFKAFKEVLRRELQILKDTKGARILIHGARRKYLQARGWMLTRGNTVIIIDPNHKFYGYTGLIVRIDTSVQGDPLYEISLDAFPRQTFVHMTIDALTTYMERQPLTKIAKRPNMRPVLESMREPMFGLYAKNPEATRRNVNAAWTIQRAYRCYVAKRRVAKKRYEMWVRRTDTQLSMMSQLTDSNSLTTQAYFLTGKLWLRPRQNIAFEEVRHTIYAERIIAAKRAEKLTSVIQMETEKKLNQRMGHIKSGVANPNKKVFTLGWRQLNSFRKLTSLMSVGFGYTVNGMMRLSDLAGGRPVSDAMKLMRSQRTMVTGLNQHTFRSFVGSPHVRFPKTAMYHGEWAGIPVFGELKPQGQGIVIFFDAWGFAREDKVLNLTVVGCNSLDSADLGSSDPFCDIYCNERHLQTSVKWATLNPIWNEEFQIDVTNPNAELNIVVKDYDYIGEDDFLGQVTIKMKDLMDGLPHHKIYELRGEGATESDGIERGTIELRLQWKDLIFDQDVESLLSRNKMATRIQAWARMLAAKTIRQQEAITRDKNIIMTRENAIRITTICRVRLARKEFKRRQRRWKAAIKIQKRVRIRQAKNIYFYRLYRWRASIIIQAYARRYNAKKLLKRLKEARKQKFIRAATVLQKRARFNYARKLVEKMREDYLKEQLNALPEGITTLPPVPPVSEWIEIYGRDPEYGLKRNRRMTEGYFQQILRHPYLRLKTRFGDCFVDRYPTLPPDSWLVEESEDGEENADDGRWICEEFVSAHFIAADPRYMQREQIIELAMEIPRTIYLHIPTSVSVKLTVFHLVTTIQCALRQKMARKAREKMIRVHKALSSFQRMFRRRFWRQHKAAFLVQALFRRIVANKIVKLIRLERKSATIIQCAYRTWLAYLESVKRRSVRGMRIIRVSSEAPGNEAHYCLDLRHSTFWVANDPKFAELRVEFPEKTAVNEVWVLTSVYHSSPKYVTVGTVRNKEEKQYEIVVKRKKLENHKTWRWMIFKFDSKISKYWKVTFEGNYGDDKCIAVREVRFVKTKEKSVEIYLNPKDMVLDMGPPVGQTHVHKLECRADAWPLPKYQWRYNGRDLPGANGPELLLNLICKPDTIPRSFRCSGCKNYSKAVPRNAFEVICSNCDRRFTFKELDAYKKLINEIYKKEADLQEEKKEQLKTKRQVETSKDETFRALLPFVIAKIADLDKKMRELKFARIEIKQELPFCNKYQGEGVYSCIVTSLRGGSVTIRRVSQVVAVVIDKTTPYLVRTYPFYKSRAQKLRSRWTIYQSLMGHFYEGKVRGIVTIRFLDDHFYEGPFIDDEYIRDDGTIPPEARASNHWGIFKANDGRIYEGPNVDNHFDPENIQGHYICRLPNNDVYEGNFVDERFFGPGKMKFADGNEYEGEWYNGKMSGYGSFRNNVEKWTYEGIIDDNKRNYEGICVWDDGSVYIGQWRANRMEGKGLFVSTMKDIYKGDFVNGKFEGKGECLYSSGGHYRGGFSNGSRQGEGHFVDRKGREFLGTYIDDKKHGDFTVKRPLQKEEGDSEINYEIRVARYNMGEFIEWTTASVNPNATKHFVRLFEEDRDAFNSVYALMLSKYLPALPSGIDDKHPGVVRILQKLRMEGGMLVASGSYKTSMEALEVLMPQIKDLRQEIAKFKESFDASGQESLRIDKEKSEMMWEHDRLMISCDQTFQKIEQFWLDDITEVRPRHQKTIENMTFLKPEHWFQLKNHRAPPPFLKKIVDTMSLLLGQPVEWKIQRQLFSDNVYNALEGDAEATRFTYHAKLVNLLERYDIYEHASLADGVDQKIINNLTDPRFRRDSYYVESCGFAAPYVVDWIKTNWSYILTARKMLSNIEFAKKKRMEASRLLYLHNKLNEEQNALAGRLQKLRAAASQLEDNLIALLDEMEKHNKVIGFVNESFLLQQKNEADYDYYETLEREIEKKQTALTVEGCMEDMLKVVVARKANEVEVFRRHAAAVGEVYVEPTVDELDLKSFILENVEWQQSQKMEEGWNLGNVPDGEGEVLPAEGTQDNIDLIIDKICTEIGRRTNDSYTARRWRMLNGKEITARFIYVIVWNHWNSMISERKLARIEQAWQSIFEDPMLCARKALESTVNKNMSSGAKEQAKVWRARNPEIISQAEIDMCAEFEAMYPEETANHALLCSENLDGDIDPGVQIASLCWIKFNPGTFNTVRDERDRGLAETFDKKFGEDCAKTAFEILNDLGLETNRQYRELAEQWRAFHMDDYSNYESDEFANMAAEFKEQYNSETFKNAATIVDNEKLHKYIRDPETAKEYEVIPITASRARAWGVKNQGLFNKGLERLRAENDSQATRHWFEIEDVTQNFIKGSYLYTTPEQKANPATDKFAGFRDRLEKRYSWMIAYLMKSFDEVTAELQAIYLEDPSTKTMHKMRPSEAQAMIIAREKEYNKRKSDAETKHAMLANKIATWNTYFGSLAERGLETND